MTTMRPVKVTATLPHGIAHASPWTVSLDGLLASQLWAQHKTLHPQTTRALDVTNPPDLDLPLARCTAHPHMWHWAATCGWPNDPAPDPEIRHWTTRLDHRHTEHTATKLPQHLPSEKGRWKAYYMPLPVSVCSSLSWHAYGDPGAITALLGNIVSIGKKRSQGEGRVTSWKVEAIDELTPFAAAHLSPTGNLARPCRPECITDPTIPTGGPGYAAIRPPHMHHSRRTDVLLPT